MTRSYKNVKRSIMVRLCTEEMGANPVVTEKLIISLPFKGDYLVLKFIRFYMLLIALFWLYRYIKISCKFKWKEN